jgi:glycoside hydrolase-like protein/putative peptidoglycan binding protein
MLGLDYAGARPGAAAIAAAGYGFVVRYLTSGGPGLPGKLLTLLEYADLQSRGIAVVVNWETTADRMRAGYSAGVSDAQSADMVVHTLRHPADRPIYFSADWDATPADQAEIDDYLRGVASVIGTPRTGVYGGYYVVKRCLDNHTATWAWQTMAWSGGQIDPRIHLLQRIGYASVGGVQCDVNEARQTDFGQYLTSEPIPLLDPGPDSIPDMAFGQTSNDVRRLQDWCNHELAAYSHLPVTGLYGPMTAAVIAEFQRRIGIPDGDGRNVGPRTKVGLWTLGYRP